MLVAAVFWTQCVLLQGVGARKERKKAKGAAPQQTEALNATVSNSEEVGGSIKVKKKKRRFPPFSELWRFRRFCRTRRTFPRNRRRKRSAQMLCRGQRRVG